MKNIKYIILTILAVSLFATCEKVDVGVDLSTIKDGSDLVTFEETSQNLSISSDTDGPEKTFPIQVKVTGPTVANLTSTITVTVAGDENSTAIEGQHYRIENKTVELSPANNYMALINVTLIMEGNEAPMDGTPEFETYVAPVLNLEIVSATGDSQVIPSGKIDALTLNFVPPNPYAGDYIAHILYFHPTAGGSYPDDPYVEEDNAKTLLPITGRKCETGFAIWGDYGYLCWITVNPDNSINFQVSSDWSYDVKLGDPNDASKVSHFDPATGIIYLYYYYTGDGGNRIFWETFYPQFK